MARTIAVRLFTALVLSVSLLAASLPARAGDWVNDWFDQSTTTSPGSLKTQQRGFYTAGAFQSRWRMTNEYPISVSAPKFSAGCGGIDMFGGGFTYMDPEYLVEKLERAIQAAPAIAFSMAMSEYCKVCQTTMESMEQITDYLNSIQINDCRLANGLGKVIVTKGDDMSVFKDMRQKADQGLAIITGQAKNQQDVDDYTRSHDGKAKADPSEAVSECPTVFNTVFSDGSIVENVTGLLSLEDYADLMRGMIGDVYIKKDTTTNNYRITPIEACPGNDPVDGFDLLTGKIEKKSSGEAASCSVATARAVNDIVRDKMQAIAGKLAVGGAALSAQDKAFISGAPFPILNMLRDAVKDGYVEDSISSSLDILASAYAFHMLDDIHNMSRLVLSKATEVSNRAAYGTGDPTKCNTDFLAPAFSAIREMDGRALQYRQIAKENYAKYQEELNANLAYANHLRERRQQSVSNEGSVLRN